MTDNIQESLNKFRDFVKGGDAIYGEDLPLMESSTAGDPDCPICIGVGFIRKDLPVGHTDFGKISPCTCRKADQQKHAHKFTFSLSSLTALQNLTFDTFDTAGRPGTPPAQASSLQAAYQASRKFSDDPHGWLLMYGAYGCGKTHLAAAIANNLVDKHFKVHFITVPDLLDWMRYSYSDPQTTFQDRFEQIRNIEVLILDDFGTENATEWAQEKIFQIINFRYINQLPTVITTNVDPEEMEGRIRSRMLDSDNTVRLHISAPDFRKAQEIYQNHHPLSSIGMLEQSGRFSNFSLRKKEKIDTASKQQLQAAVNAARQYADNPQGWIAFTGKSGSGKTHLAASIANHCAEEYLNPLFTNVPDLLDHLRATFNPKSSTSYDKQFNEIKNAPLLILDDVGTHSATPWASEKLFQLFNFRHIGNRPTVMTISDLDSLKNSAPRLYNRIIDTNICRIFPTGVPSFHQLHQRRPAANQQTTDKPSGF